MWTYKDASCQNTNIGVEPRDVSHWLTCQENNQEGQEEILGLQNYVIVSQPCILAYSLLAT